MIRHISSILAVLFSMGTAQAIEFKSETPFTLPSEESIDEELWINADDIDIQGTVNDDLFFFGNMVELGGTFTDDVWGMAKRAVKITGQMDQDLRIYGQKTIQLNGTVTEDLMAFGDTVQLDTNAVVKGSAIIRGRVVVITGQHEGDLRISAAESVSINGKIDGDVFLEGNGISVEPGTEITGNLSYNAPRELILKNGVVLNGELIRSKNIDPAYERSVKSAILGLQMLMFITTLVFGMIFLRLFPKGVHNAVNIAQNDRRPALLVGSATLLGLGLFAIVAFASVVGIPMGLLLTATLMLLVTSGKVVVAFTVGQWILKQKGKRVNSVMQTFSLFVGLLFVYLATMLPFVGGFIWFVVSFLGVGTILLMMINSQRELETSETPPPAEDPFSVA